MAYTVSTVDTVRDEDDSDVWMTSWDGARSIQLTHSPAGEHAPRWSGDGRYLAFLSDRDDPHESDQLWLLDRSGGEAERVTDLPGGVSDYAWAPDGTRLALIVEDPDSDAAVVGDTAKKTPKPIVIDRYRFKADETGFVTGRREHLYLFDLATRQADLLMPGDFDEISPSWSPDGRSIAFVSRRRPEPDRTDNYDLYVVEARSGAEPRQVTTYPGGDSDPGWGGRGPSWSPDGKSLAYVQGGPLNLIYYAVQNVAVIPAAGGTPKILTPRLDRQVLSPTWSARRLVGALSPRGRPRLSPGAGTGRRWADRACGWREAGRLRSHHRRGREDRRTHQQSVGARRDLRRGGRSRASAPDAPE